MRRSKGMPQGACGPNLVLDECEPISVISSIPQYEQVEIFQLAIACRRE
jgi:hypothetical protein